MNGRVFYSCTVGILLVAGVYSVVFPRTVRVSQLDAVVGTTTTVTGRVLSDPVRTDVGQRFVFSPVDDSSGDAHRFRILVTADTYPTVSYGETVTISGTLERPVAFDTASGRRFNYPRYLAKDGIGYIIRYPQITSVGVSGGNLFWRGIFAIRYFFLDGLRRVVPEPHATLLAGITLGVSDSLPRDLEENFRRAGLSHILVLSGYNITVVSEAIGTLLIRFGPIIASAGSVFSVAALILVSGASASAVRAGIMAALVIGARIGGFSYDALRALMLAAALMALENPAIILYDPSFQLSFLATFGLVAVAPHANRWFARLRRYPRLRESVVTTVSAQIAVMPLLIYQNGTVGVFSLIANVAVLWSVPPAMFFSAVAGMVGAVSPLVATVVAVPAHAAAVFILSVSQFFSAMPFSEITTPSLSVGFLVLTYGVLCFVFLPREQNHPVRQLANGVVSGE